ncbi:hypothetical protein [Vibrio hippocampi]|uniref:Uncharacterized protein n=1 Tax=Vibrio hippocampi TaxID=654686 RepID=A0ABM8ZN56_9VIBR|nr:hypothetical protein [Vibrio hippocampi]CAH0530011.1 hypothetical protein VHP8226_03737 [Vibrio hippocampi]
MNKIHALLVLIFSVLTVLPARAADYDEIEVIFTVEYVPVTCLITVPPVFDLGMLARGTSGSVGNVAVDIDCDHIGYATGLTATSTDLVVGDVTALELRTDAEMNLKYAGAAVDLDGSEEFCIQVHTTASRSCVLDVVTTIGTGADTGWFSKPVVFTLTYP